jgi:septum formation protein
MLILASRSPRRAELLRQVGIPFQAVSAAIDETVKPGETPADYVRRLALAKADAVRRHYPEAPILGSDTAVVLNGRILGKPAGRDAAVEMLLALGGHTHEVLTGVALLSPEGHPRYALSISEVSFRKVDTDEAGAYWASGEPADKAGSYAIQGLGAAFVRHIAGSYSGIMGLPLFETLKLLSEVGIHCPIEGAGGA